MSLPILDSVAEEMRRLALAGASVAPGDFRLKKLLPALEQAGAKAPVFAKVHDAAKAVVESKDAAGPLLDLTTLVNAIRYTQGATTVAGELTPIAITDLGLASKQSSARTLKPLLEALTSTGSGRLEHVNDAIASGAFHDLRLVGPALGALNDPWGEIADAIADKVLPNYGSAILPLLKAQLDLKGKTPDARRLRLLHKLDPSGARPLVLQALDDGGKEVKIAAAECLGKEDLPLLLEQAKAKAPAVRTAAYRALATVDSPEARAALIESLDKDYDASSSAFSDCKSPEVFDAAFSRAVEAYNNLDGKPDPEIIDSQGPRLQKLLELFEYHDNSRTDDLIEAIFDDAPRLEKLQGKNFFGSHLVRRAVQIMNNGSGPLVVRLAAAYATIPLPYFSHSVIAAIRVWKPIKVYKTFSPYLLSSATQLKISAKELGARRKALTDALCTYSREREKLSEADPRWVDALLNVQEYYLLQLLVTPGNVKVIAWLDMQFAKHGKDHGQQIIRAMIAVRSPAAVAALVDTLQKNIKSGAHHYHSQSLMDDIQRMPSAWLPQLEAAVPHVPEPLCNYFVKQVESLRQSSP